MDNKSKDSKTYPVLSRVDVPDDIRRLNVNELKNLCDDIREFIVETISHTGGHLGAGLGAVELTVALHYVFDTPKDKLVWDVGHQGYPHKIITGRKEVFHTIRQLGGISGFLKPSESGYDTFGAGHASTAISAALGIATARDLSQEKYRVIAIVGDGAMTGGMAYEAMNNAGLQKRNLIVVLNDNNMSIGPNVWAVSNYFTDLIAHPSYNRFKSNMWELTHKLDTLGDRIRKLASRVEEGLKVIITPGILFEALGFRYFGPVNGHNINKLIKIFSDIKDLSGPILVHVITRKGKGYKPAEEDDQALHGVTPFDKTTGIAVKKEGTKPTYTEVFGESIVRLAKENPKIIGITAAMPEGTGLDKLRNEIPERFFDVGIAEQHAVTFAAGLAISGYVPVVAIYSTFLQRAFDQVVHDVALQNLHVVFCIDRGGLVGSDGPTHHGVLDISYLRIIPNMVIMSPKDEEELRHMFYTAIYDIKGPVAIRFPRGSGIGVVRSEDFHSVRIGEAEVLKSGNDLAILAIGNMVYPSLKAAENLLLKGINAEVINMKFIKPLDEKILKNVCERFHHIIIVEDNVINGGFGSAVAEYIASKKYTGIYVKCHGIPDRFIEQGTISELHSILHLDAVGISITAEKFYNSTIHQSQFVQEAESYGRNKTEKD